MRKLIVSQFITLDGVIQAPGGADEDRVGGGKRLFVDGGALARFKLVDATPYPTGVVGLHYERQA
jgi:hypothetical protein